MERVREKVRKSKRLLTPLHNYRQWTDPKVLAPWRPSWCCQQKLLQRILLLESGSLFRWTVPKVPCGVLVLQLLTVRKQQQQKKEKKRGGRLRRHILTYLYLYFQYTFFFFFTVSNHGLNLLSLTHEKKEGLYVFYNNVKIQTNKKSMCVCVLKHF